MKETLIKINPKTDFEKLLFAISEIKELKNQIKLLKTELGIISSEKDEYKYQLNKYLTNIVKGDWKKMYENSQKALISRNKTITNLRKTNSEIILKLSQKQSSKIN